MMNEKPIQMVIEAETDPVELARAKARAEHFERNWSWMEAHASEVYSHRGKVIAIAGEELFVADTVEAVIAKAKAAHPEDDGQFTRYIPKERTARIYAI
jgi:hypothetical protein